MGPEALRANVVALLARLVAATLEVEVKTYVLARWVLPNATLVKQLTRHSIKPLIFAFGALAFAATFLFGESWL